MILLHFPSQLPHILLRTYLGRSLVRTASGCHGRLPLTTTIMATSGNTTLPVLSTRQATCLATPSTQQRLPLTDSTHTTCTTAQWEQLLLLRDHTQPSYHSGLKKLVRRTHSNSTLYLVFTNFYTSLSTAPSVPPRSVQATVLSSTSIRLTWSPPTVEGTNGIIRRYEVSISDVPNQFSLTTSHTVYNLRPYRSYRFRVAAHTLERGPFSVEVEAQTLQDGKIGCALNTYRMFVVLMI